MSESLQEILVERLDKNPEEIRGLAADLIAYAERLESNGEGARSPIELPDKEHVDDFIDDYFARDEWGAVRFVLYHFRLSAAYLHQFESIVNHFELSCEYKGKRYRVTGASRLGDIWLRSDFSQTSGYDTGGRVLVKDCSNWGLQWNGPKVLKAAE